MADTIHIQRKVVDTVRNLFVPLRGLFPTGTGIVKATATGFELVPEGSGGSISGAIFEEQIVVQAANTFEPLSFQAIPESLQLFINGVEYNRELWTYNSASRVITWQPLLFTLPAAATRFVGHVWYRTQDAIIPPAITAVSPPNGTIGAVLTITGTGFGGASVTIGGVPVTIVSSTPTQIQVTVPAGLGLTGAKNIVVTTKVPPAASTNWNYTRPAPVIASFSPVSGSSGSTITITGQHFTGATAVTFGGTAAAAFTVVNDTTITAVVAAGASGNVAVTTADGTGTRAGFAYQSLWQNIVAYWRLDELSGNRLNAVNPATNVMSVVTAPNSVVSGRIGNAPRFVGGGVYFSTPSNSDVALGAKDWSFSFWWYPESASNFGLFSKGVFAAEYNCSIQSFGGVAVRLRLRTTTPSFPDIFNPAPRPVWTNNTWYHIVIAHNAANKRITYYINNIAYAPQFYTGVLATTTDALNIGTSEFSRFDRFDEFGIWHRELSAGDVNTLFNGGNGFPYP